MGLKAGFGGHTSGASVISQCSVWQNELPIRHCFLFGIPQACKCVMTVTNINHSIFPLKTFRAVSDSESVCVCVRLCTINHKDDVLTTRVQPEV